MNAEEFVLELKKLVPHGEYYNSNRSKEFVELQKKSYVLVQKNQLPTIGNCVLDLINNYDCFYIGFGDYSFKTETTNINGIQVFGGSSGTYLGFKDLDGEVLEFDWDENSLLGACAINSECFLKAILVISKFYSNVFMGLINENNKKEEKERCIEKCCEVAGSIKYEHFYRTAIWG